MPTPYKLLPYGSCGLLIQFEDEISLETHQRIVSLYEKISLIKGVLSVIPAYTSITVRYNHTTDFKTLSDAISILNQTANDTKTTTKEISIPVCYDEALALDLEEVKQHTKLSHQEIVQLHTSIAYPVYMIGFTPGFPYLGGLDTKLHTPRKSSPRLATPKGSVGLANNQTGIYPSASPGGWQIIGQTPISIFRPTQQPMINIGDTIRFEAISIERFNKLKNEN